MMDFALFLALFLAALLSMEAVAWITHKYIMHGWLWVLHESHHRPRTGNFERNDLFAVFFSLPSILLIYVGVNHFAPALPLGLGILGYGIVYFVFHDVIVHKRLKSSYRAKSDYMKRIIQAHRFHHAVHGKDGCVSFGFLYAPPVRELKAQLRARGVSVDA